MSTSLWQSCFNALFRFILTITALTPNFSIMGPCILDYLLHCPGKKLTYVLYHYNFFFFQNAHSFFRFYASWWRACISLIFSCLPTAFTFYNFCCFYHCTFPHLATLFTCLHLSLTALFSLTYLATLHDNNFCLYVKNFPC